MGDIWDYRLRKMEIAWELATRIIRTHPQNSGAWTEEAFVGKAQEVMKEACEAIDAVFKEDKPGQ